MIGGWDQTELFQERHLSLEEILIVGAFYEILKEDPTTDVIHHKEETINIQTDVRTN